MAAHPGPAETLRSLSKFHWWPSLDDDNEQWSRTCHLCQTSKTGGATLDAQRGNSMPVTAPFELVYIDLIEYPYPTARGNRYIISFTDSATRFKIAVPSSTKSAATVADALIKNVLLVFGTPDGPGNGIHQ
jgi:hypothetical protein